MPTAAELCYLNDGVVFDKWRFEDAEKLLYVKASSVSAAMSELRSFREDVSSMLNEVRTPAKTPAKSSDKSPAPKSPASTGARNQRDELEKRVAALETENVQLRSALSQLQADFKRLEAHCQTYCPTPSTSAKTATTSAPTPTAEKSSADAAGNNDDEDDIDLFGSDDEEEDAEAERIKQERVAEYEKRKASKKQVIAKSNVIMDVKPWDDETDLKKMEEVVRSIQMDGLLWGVSELVPIAYGVKKLRISCVVEDEKVSVQDLEDQISDFEEFVQSVDIVAFNKI